MENQGITVLRCPVNIIWNLPSCNSTELFVGGYVPATSARLAVLISMNMSVTMAGKTDV